MTHDQQVEKAIQIFAALKERKQLLAMSESERASRPYPENDDAELRDFGKDMVSVVAIEKLGIGNADCFAIADVLLRAIERQWDDEIDAQ